MPAIVMRKVSFSLTAALLAAAFVSAGCARLRGPSTEGKMLLFSAVGELRPVGANGDLFGSADPLAELKPFLADRSLVMADLAGGIDCRTESPSGLAWKPEWTEALAAANLRIQSLADDHALDCGPTALAAGINRLLLREFYLVGAGPDQKMARAPVYLTRDGLSLGLVAFLAAPLPGATCDNCPGPAVYDRRALISALNEMKSRSDFRVAVLHFTERSGADLPAEDLAIAREAVDYGANLVIGYGPPTAGAISRIRGRWVIGSLGRALGGNGPECDGLLLSAEFTPDKIMNLRLLPIALLDGKPRILRGEPATTALRKIIDAAPADAQANMNLVGDILYLK